MEKRKSEAEAHMKITDTALAALRLVTHITKPVRSLMRYDLSICYCYKRAFVSVSLMAHTGRAVVQHKAVATLTVLRYASLPTGSFAPHCALQ
jgi:hypothetical protein